MIRLVEDTIFNTPAEWIVNTINCVGFMGKGLALEFALRYPELERIYKEQCHKKEINIGKIYDYNINGTKIINFPTKYHYRYDSKYEWIELGLKDFVSKYKKLNIKSIAFPYLGCANGGLDYKVVEKIMIKYLNIEGLDVYICSSKKLGGKEKEMLEKFQSTDLEQLFKIGNLNVTQREQFSNKYLSIRRFYEILSIPKIGLKTYQNYFNYFYKDKNEVKPKNIALSIFDFIDKNQNKE